MIPDFARQTPKRLGLEAEEVGGLYKEAFGIVDKAVRRFLETVEEGSYEIDATLKLEAHRLFVDQSTSPLPNRLRVVA